MSAEKKIAGIAIATAEALPAPDKPEAAGAILSAVENVLDGVADDHKDHDCGTSEIALGLSARVRLEREKLGGGTKSGPAQVATKTYRDNYDVIFMSKGGSA